MYYLTVNHFYRIQKKTYGCLLHSFSVIGRRMKQILNKLKIKIVKKSFEYFRVYFAKINI